MLESQCLATKQTCKVENYAGCLSRSGDHRNNVRKGEFAEFV